jgi:hypothetical protein
VYLGISPEKQMNHSRVGSQTTPEGPGVAWLPSCFYCEICGMRIWAAATASASIYLTWVLSGITGCSFLNSKIQVVRTISYSVLGRSIVYVTSAEKTAKMDG